MQLIKSPNAWSCLLASAAMVLDVPIKKLIKEIGHDGSEIMVPSLPEPACRAGIHMQNIIDCAFTHSHTVTPIEARPCSSPDSFHEFEIKFPENRFQNHLFNNQGILTGLANKWYHAVAWDGNMCFDPRGTQCKFYQLDMDTETFWRFEYFDILC